MKVIKVRILVAYAYSPSRLIDDELENKIINKIIRPTLKGLSAIGTEYKGFLYSV